MTLNPRETATILAALRFWQANEGMPSAVFTDIATNDGCLVALGMDEIDRLCERLNFFTDGETVKVRHLPRAF
jgi:hypothetical protein